MVKSRIATALSSLAVVFGLSISSAVQAETPAPGWTAVKLDSSETNVRTDGTLKYAYTASTTALSANGVTFSPWVSSGWDANTQLKNDDVTINEAFMRNTNAGYGSATGGYATLLNNSFWNNVSGDYNIVLGGLTVGNRYLAQIIVHNNNDRPKLSVKGSNPEIYVQPCGFDGAISAGWDYGGSLIYVFDATGDTETLPLTYSQATPIAFNAIQVRDLSGGDDPDPTVVDPEIGAMTATVNGMAVTIDLSGIVLGTDAQGAAATSYKVDFEVRNSVDTAIKSGTVLSGQTAETASFDITNFTDPGTYTCEVTITTDKETTASKSVEFTLVGEGPTEVWTAEPMSASGDTIRKDGDFVYGYARKGGNGTYTVNGVTFTAFNDGGDFKQESKNPNVSISPNTFDWTTGLGSESISGDYGSMLDNAFWNATVSGNYTITLKNLEARKSYLVQVVAHRFGQTYSVTSPDPAKAITVGGNGWTYGGSLVGVFAAETTEYSFTLNYGGSFVLNAIQVRKIEGVTPPTPATYAVSWTGGANASVDVKANGSAISSGALVGDGTNVVFTVTPNTDYEFAEASYQNWTKSGDALTRTVTVNGEAVSITIPDATAKVTPPPGPTPTEGWTATAMSESGDTIRTDGELVYAYARGTNYTTNQVNGVNFVRFADEGDFRSKQSHVAFSPQMQYWDGGLGNEGLETNYGELLKNGFKTSTDYSSVTVTLNGLEAGKTYLVQLIMHKSSSSYSSTVGDATAYTGGDGWQYGGSLEGVFVASTVSESFTLANAGGWFVMNAIQVRDISSISPDPPPVTYAVSWTGGANASVDAKANGSAISSGAMVGDGTNVVFTVTPNTDYEFAEESYQDWTKSGDVLTRTVTVNGAAVNIEIPDATEKTTPPPGPTPTEGWTVSAMTTSADLVIEKQGDFLYAYRANSSALTVDGVTFSAGNDASNMNIAFSSEFELDSNSGGQFGDLLATAWKWDNTHSRVTLTLNGLTKNHVYLVQILAHNGWGNPTITVGEETPVYIGGGDQAANIVGIFKAQGTAADVELKFGGGAAARMVNAIQVRDLGEGEPEPATYEVSWSGGNNASVVVEANGTGINSGALVGDGTNVVFTVTPNTDYEFAEASYQDWTKSGEALTRTVTVNGAAVDVTIPNATAKSGPTPVEGDWYVSPDGDDSNNGKSADTPYATIAKAVSSAANGDVICVLAGNYTVTSVIDVSKAITIKGEGWDKTIVNGGSNRMFALKNAGAKLEGLKLTGSTANTRGAAVHMTDGTISRCFICGNSRTGSDFLGGAVSILKGTIDHSIFANNTSTKSGAAIGGSTPNGDILIDTCLVYGNTLAEGCDGVGGIDIDGMNSATCTIRNCTIVGNASSGDYPAGVRVTGSGSVVLVNNILSGNMRTFSGSTTEVNLSVTKAMLDQTNSRNCLITGGKASDGTYYRDGLVTEMSELGFINGAPLFTNEGVNDYTLSASSPAIAAGVTYSGIGADLAGNSFANPPAIGCYEYDGVTPGPTVVKPSIESAVASVDAAESSAQITLTGIEKGTDDSGDPATSYSVVYVLDEGTEVEALTGQSAASVNFNLTGLAKGDHSLIVRVVTNKGKTAAKTINFRVNNAEVEYGWTGTPMTTDPASVRTDGVLSYAYACNGNRTVNGVEFLKLDPTDNENLAWNVSQTSSSPLPEDFSGGYGDLLSNQWWAGGDTLTLRNLIPGHDYLVQVIGCRYNNGDTKLTKVTVTEAGDESIFMKAAGDDEWVYGGTLVGVFNAKDTTQTFHFKKITGSWSAFNAVQVRDLSLMDEDAVAIIERGATTNYFFTISDAYRGAADGETIKLVKDADFPANDPVFSKSVDIDLNGFSLTRSNLAHVKEITSDTAITNGTIAFDSGVYPADTATPFLVGSGATLTLDTLNVGDANGHEPLCLISVEDGSHVVLSGEGTYHVGSLFNSVADGNTMTITGGRYILRGWFMPANRVYLFADYKKGNVSISGGAFSIAPDNSWIASGYRILHDINDHETPYHVVPASEAPYTESGWSYYYKDAAAAEAAHVAKRETAGGVKYYTSLRDAVSSANGSGTVTLVADIPALDRGVTLGGTVTLDGAGHKVSVAHPYVNDSGFVANDFSFNIINIISVYPKEADVTLRNISLTGGGLLDGELSNDGLAVVDNAGKLLMENVTVTRSNGAVYNEQTGVLYMDNCRLVRNCRYCAGGLFNVTGGFAVMNRSSLSENRSLGMAGGGGACENGGTLFVNNCVIVNNSSTEVGGAINNYASNHQPKLYMMNTTVSGNFSSIYEDNNAFEHDKGGAIGMRGEAGAEFFAVNSLFSCNYQTDTRTGVEWGPITVSDMCSIDGGTAVKLYYSVYTGLKSKTPANTSTTEVRVINEYETSTNVFNAYFASPRVYQNAQPTAMAINGAQLISKDDGSMDAALARYAPILRIDNGDGTYEYGQAVYGTDGVYTYFDPSNWKSKSVAMSYAPVDTSKGAVDFFNYEAAGTMQAIAELPTADPAYMVTNYYESASGRSFGVAGASGWLKGDVTYYTVKLVAEPENGTVSGATINGETYEEGTVIQLTATPGYARDFLGWYEITAGGATTNFIEGSNKTVWELTVDHNYELLAKFSDLQEVLTPDPYVHVKMADDTEGPLLYPITMMTKWMRDHYENFEDTLAGKTKAEAEEWLTQILEQTSPGTGRKMWQDYVLGVDPNDADAKIWINSPQIRQEGQTAIRMEMNRLSPASGTKFTINYRLDKKLGDAATFARADVNGTGSYDVKVENDPTGLYVIDLLFIPEGKSTSEEYVTTVNTAGVLRVASGAKRAAISVPWTKLQPTGSSAVNAVDLVKTTNLTPNDVLYVYDLAERDYRAWKMNENGGWSPLNVFSVDENGLVKWDDPEVAAVGSEVARGLGIWLERANTNDFIYVCGQYDAASVASTEVSEGWNLVGNSSAAAFDISRIAPVSEDDRIVVPTAEEPLNISRNNRQWGYYKSTTVEYGGREFTKSVWTTTDLVVPAGAAFWYISTGQGEIDWTGSEDKEGL